MTKLNGSDRLTIDCYEESTLRSLGYTHVEFRLGDQSKEVAL